MIHPNSHAAYQELDLSKRQVAVLEVYKDRVPLTDRTVLHIIGRSQDLNSVRPRITELLAAGLLVEKNKTVCPWTGRTVRLVGIVEAL